MIAPSSQPTDAQMYAELRLVSVRVRWLRRACVLIVFGIVTASLAVWVFPNGTSWGL